MKNSFINKNNITVVVFFGILITVAAISAVSIPNISSKISSIFIKIQTDVNKRTAENVSFYIRNKMASGASLPEVLKDVQVLISNSQSDKGYTCIIDAKSGKYLNHPMLSLIGVDVSMKNAHFTSIDKTVQQPYKQILLDKKNQEGVLDYPDMEVETKEAVAIFALKDLNVSVSTHENIAQLQKELTTLNKNIFYTALLISLLVAIFSTIAARKISKQYEDKIEEEKDKNEKLLLNVLPKSVVDEINKKGSFLPRKYDSVSVLFFDIVGFTKLASKTNPVDLVEVLNAFFQEVDKLIEKYQAEKIKTMGDGYMICSGAPVENSNHVRNTILLAQDIYRQLQVINKKLNLELDIRIGINTGSIIAGIIGKTKFSFDLWGDAVNIASRMESSGVAGKVQVTENVYQLAKEEFEFEDRGEITIKGKGSMQTYLLK